MKSSWPVESHLEGNTLSAQRFELDLGIIQML